MRVVLLNQYFAPSEAASARLLADLGAALVDRGHQVSCICSRRAYADPSTRYPRRETIDGVEVFRGFSTGFGRGNRLGRVLDYLSFLSGAFFRLIVHPRTDVIVSLTTPPLVAFLGLVASRLRGGRSVYWVMDIYPELAFRLGVMRRNSLTGRCFSRLSRYVLRRSDRVVALGQAMAERLDELGAANVAVVHNWADGSTIRPQPVERHPLRERWGWGGRFVVLYSGNLGLAHDFETALDAAERLRGHAGILFAFVGDGPRRAWIEREVHSRQLDNVELRPYVPESELGLGLTSGDLHLVTLREGMQGLLVPCKIYGILAAGRPSIYVGPPAGEIPRILAEGDCGVSVPPGDAGELVRRLLAYAESAPLCAQHGRRAREAFDRRYTMAHGTTALCELIEAAADSATDRP